MQKFIVFATQRTGSRFLIEYMGSHPHIDCHDEIFIAPRYDKSPKYERYYKYCSHHPIRNLLYNLRLHSLLIPSFLNSFFQDHDPEITAKGFKLMYSQSRKFRLHPKKLTQKNIRLIHLIRENPLKILISREISKLRGIAHTTKSLHQIMIQLDTHTLLSDLRSISAQTHHYKRIFQKLEHLEIVYEKLIRSLDKESPKILDYLGVDNNTHLISKTKKITSDNLRHVLANFQDVKNTLLGTPYYQFIE
jgi:hypothetical protein